MLTNDLQISRQGETNRLTRERPSIQSIRKDFERRIVTPVFIYLSDYEPGSFASSKHA